MISSGLAAKSLKDLTNVQEARGVGRLVAGRETASGAAAMDWAEGGWRGGTQARLAWLAARRHAGGGRCRRTAWACVGGQRGPQRQGKGTQANEPDRRLRRGAAVSEAAACGVAYRETAAGVVTLRATVGKQAGVTPYARIRLRDDEQGDGPAEPPRLAAAGESTDRRSGDQAIRWSGGQVVRWSGDQTLNPAARIARPPSAAHPPDPSANARRRPPVRRARRSAA
ncbi:Uncharacterised protein [Burkholderia pseudomallei]|nr:Uncharacterised protein [Burkholderia pseudomallei]CAJ6446263.1 Uncharacterised protein [Burkholderia pseudomallei]CAJ8494667.1 Uncharacterised protein [Burkholderia pseudomallei]CAJ9063385.1 Uncharacterised protein [Burkholderia pseudomallei]VBE13798.1 Uncharacterised protein [Burkholderia pseudomallei]